MRKHLAHERLQGLPKARGVLADELGARDSGMSELSVDDERVEGQMGPSQRLYHPIINGEYNVPFRCRYLLTFVQHGPVMQKESFFLMANHHLSTPLERMIGPLSRLGSNLNWQSYFS